MNWAFGGNRVYKSPEGTELSLQGVGLGQCLDSAGKSKASLCNKEVFAVPTEMSAAGEWNEEKDADPRRRVTASQQGGALQRTADHKEADRGSGF